MNGSKKCLLLFDKILIERPKMFTCPLKSIVVFAHNQDIDIKESEMLRIFNNCKNVEDVHALKDEYSDLLPPVYESSLISSNVSQNSANSNLALEFEYVTFN